MCVCVYCGDKIGFRLICGMRLLRLILEVLLFVLEMALDAFFAREDSVKEISCCLFRMENGK